MRTSKLNNTVVIVGPSNDEHVDQVARRLGNENIEVFVVNTLAFPEITQISLTDDLAGITVNDCLVGHPGAVYFRNLCAHPLSFGVDAQKAMDNNWKETLVAFREKATLLLGLLGRWEAMGVPMYNPPSSDWRTYKPLQLSLLKQAGLPVPKTLWSNQPEAVRQFAAQGRVVYKPVFGGAATEELKVEDLTDARLLALQMTPVTFQELLPGEDIRVYVLDGKVVASFRITSNAIDFRQNEQNVEFIHLQPEVEQQCLRAAEVIGLRWTGIDLKRDAFGMLRFLELNSSAMFLGFDTWAGTDILGEFVATLANAALSEINTRGRYSKSLQHPILNHILNPHSAP